MNEYLTAIINGFGLNNPATGTTISADIVGLDTPPIRTSQGVLSGTDGGYIGAQNYGPRNIAISGTIATRSPADTAALCRALQVATPIRTDLPLEVVTVDGRNVITTTRLIKLDMPLSPNPLVARFNLELVAPDPLLYDGSASGLNSVAISPARGGGVRWPMRWKPLWKGGTVPVTATNNGTVVIYPVATLTGSMTNPILTNLTTGEFIKLDAFSTAAGSQVVIDMAQHTVSVDGGSAYRFLSADSRWIGLVPGNNALRLNTGSGSDTVTGVVEWRTGYLSL